MPKKEIVKNDLVTVRVDPSEPLKLVENTLDAIEDQLDVVEAQVGAAAVAVRSNKPLVIGVFVVALGVGGFVGYKLSRKRLQAQFDERLEGEIEATKTFYQRMAKEGEYESPESAVATLIDAEVVVTEEDVERADIQVVEEPLATAAGEAVRKYQGAAKRAKATRPAKVEIKNVFVESGADYVFDVEMESRSQHKPYVISADEFNHNDTNFDQQTLTYFKNDDVLSDSRDAAIEDVDNIIGDNNLLRFGHGSGDKNIVYVRNHKLSVDFEVIYSEGSFAEEVLGLTHSDDYGRRGQRRFRGSDE